MGIAEHIKQEEHTCKTFDISDRNYTLSGDILPTESEMEMFENEVSTAQTKVGMDAFPTDMFNQLVSGLLQDGKFRDVCMLICQANWGMRFGDLVNVRVVDVMTKDGQLQDKFYLYEKKTQHTRKVKQTRCFYNNKAVKKVLMLLLQNSNKRWYDYLFTSESNNAPKICIDGKMVKQPMSRTVAETTIKNGIKKYVPNSEELKLNTHSLRKMYGTLFVQKGTELMQSGKLENNMNILFLAQNDFGHSSMAISQRYIGQVETMKAIICNELNIGLAVLNKFLEG